MSTVATPKAKSPAKAKAKSFSDIANENITALNNGFGSWEGFLFGEFTELGTACLENADHLSVADALARINCAFQVGIAPAQYQSEAGPVIVPERFVTYRDDTGEALGVVGPGYRLIQTASAFGPAESLAEASNNAAAIIGAAGINNGAQIAVLHALPPLNLGNDEGVLPVVLTWTSHDGSKVVHSVFVPIRLACFNGNLWYVKGQSASLRVKHTVSAPDKLDQAHKIWAASSSFFAGWEKEAKKLIKSKISIAKADAFLLQLVPVPEKTQKAETIADTLRDAIRARYLHSENLQNVQGTKYALLQAVSEYVDYDHRTRVVDDGRPTEERKSELLWLRSVDSHPLKERAHALLVA